MKELKTTAGLVIEKRQWQCEQEDESGVVETTRSYAPGIVGINQGRLSCWSSQRRGWGFMAE